MQELATFQDGCVMSKRMCSSQEVIENFLLCMRLLKGVYCETGRFSKHVGGKMSATTQPPALLRTFPHFCLCALFILQQARLSAKSERVIQSPTLFLLYVCFFTLSNLIPTHCMGFPSFVVSFHSSVSVLQGVVINAGNEWRFSKLPRTLPCC